MTGSRIALPLGVAIACAIAALTLIPAGMEARSLLFAQDDPTILADHTVDELLNPQTARQEIESALAADDPDLAKSFLDLAKDKNVPVDPALAAKVEDANSAGAETLRNVGNFGRGLITGQPDDLAGLAGTALGDLFVFGDIRDAVREGSHFIAGQPTDELILGLSCVGLAITAGTYATVGVSAPVRVGVSVLKAARKTGRLTARMAGWLGRSLRQVVDWTALRRALGSMSVTEPAVAARAAREAVKIEKADGLVRVVGDVGRVQAKAGTRAALDGLRLAETPRDVSRIARVAEKYGSKTRAVLKLGGRAAILLTASAFNLFSWLFFAIVTVFGFISSCKKTVERATERHLRRRKEKRQLAKLHEAMAALRAAETENKVTVLRPRERVSASHA